MAPNPIPGIDPTVPPSGTGCVECLAGVDAGWWLHFLGQLSAGHEFMPDKRPTTLVVSVDDLRPWRDRAKQFAVLQEGRFEVLGDRAHLADDGCVVLRIAEERGGVIGHQGGDALDLVPAAAQAAEGGRAGEEGLRRDAPQGDEDLRRHELDLGRQVGGAGRDLVRLGIAV